jgi:dephospho-CoA kinase
MTKQFVVGLTGGIASGKSAAADIFVELGVSLIDTDLLARVVVAPGSDTLKAIANYFGPDLIKADGTLDRRRLREIVFSDLTAKIALEKMTHPKIRALVKAQIDERYAAAIPPAYVLVAIPLIAENGRYPFLNRVLVVDIPESLQLERLISRDKIDQSLAKQMISAQSSRASRLAIADDVIVNDGSLLQLRQRVTALHMQYLQRVATGEK